MVSPQQSSKIQQSIDGLALTRPIPTVRDLVPSDWKQLKELRIEGLQKHGNLFSEPVEEAVKRSDLAWQELIQDPRSKVLGAFVGDVMVGISAIFTDRDDPNGKTGFLGMSYIREEYRGKEVSREFFERRISWARASSNIERLVVAHREGNEPSRRNAVREGFIRDSETKDFRFTDGSVDTLVRYYKPLYRQQGATPT